jgi:DNA polymerase-3 subunit delta'
MTNVQPSSPPANALLGTLRAQDTARATLERALSSDRVHHAYLFEGPSGVGKELAAFGLAQALVCEARQPGVAHACGQCSACRRAEPKGERRVPAHPDVVVIERGLHEAARIGRKTEETQEISIDQIRTLVLARSAFGPHEGRAKVFIVRRAEELSISAANALLKTLEEPDPKTHFILLSAERAWLLPTILSRTLPLRFASLPDAVITDLLTERGTDATLAAQAAVVAQGSMSVAMGHIDEEVLARRQEFVSRCMGAASAPDTSLSLELAEHEKKDKSLLVDNLTYLASALRGFGAQAARNGHDPVPFAEAHALTLRALREIDANASPQLAVETLMFRMRGLRALTPEAPPDPR